MGVFKTNTGIDIIMYRCVWEDLTTSTLLAHDHKNNVFFNYILKSIIEYSSTIVWI